MAGHRPLTVVSRAPVDTSEIVARLDTTRATHGPLLADFQRVWYESRHTWVLTHFMGVGVLKSPFDLWIYHEIIAATKPKTIIETGSCFGGSALWFAFLQDVLNIEGGRVLSIDIENRHECDHPRITWIDGDSTDPALAAEVLAQVEHPLLVSLDADHSQAHVTKELALYAPAVQPGEFLVVEDTCIAWPGVDEGAMGALRTFLQAHPGEWEQDQVCERYLSTMNPGGWLRRMRECACAPQ